MQRLVGILGILLFVLIAYLFSSKKKSINWQTIAWGFGLQITFAVLILKTTPGKWLFSKCNDIIIAILNCAQDGARFVFGNLVNMFVEVGKFDQNGNFVTVNDLVVNNGMAIFAFSVLPTIIFFSALMSILYHYGIMQRVVAGIAWVMSKTMKTSGSESLSAASNIFVGQTEAPLVIKPYLKKMTLSELNAVMVCGFATVAGGVLAAYVGLLKDVLPDIAGHLLAASIMSAPAGLIFAKIFVPETEESETYGGARIIAEKVNQNGIDAAASGAGDGLRLALNVGAMLIAFIGLVALVNLLLGQLPGDLSLAKIFGWVLAPVAWVMGIPTSDIFKFGDLLGTKLMVTEFIAYMKLQTYAASLSPKSMIIGAYALCGFANLGSIGIQIGGISALVSERRGELAKLGVKAMIAGAFASWTTACIAGILL
jgi:CNT family concentrative nucleoside transporter